VITIKSKKVLEELPKPFFNQIVKKQNKDKSIHKYM